jgi:tRNA(Ile)-lysidine synthase
MTTGGVLAPVLPFLLACRPIQRALVAYSGGPDSTALLYWLAKRRHELTFPLAAVHVNHGLQPEALFWEFHCRRCCEALAVPLQVVRLQVRASEGGTESAARNARYAALAGLLKENEVVLTGHSRDDQAETVLLQLLRGSGPHGLAGMPHCRSLGDGRLLRPLLEIPRKRLHTYLTLVGATWVEDPSNNDPALLRVWIRHQLVPLLQRRWPTVSRTLARNAGHFADAAKILDEVAGEELEACRRGRTLAVAQLLSLARPRGRLVLRRWIREQGAQVPDTARLERLLNEVAGARGDANPRVNWGHWEVHRHRGALHLEAAWPPLPANFERQFPEHGVLPLPQGGSVRLRAVAAGDPLALDVSRLPLAELRVTARRTGDRLRPHPSAARRAVKDLLREHGIPSWWRQRLPVLRIGKRCLALPGVAVEADFRAADDTPGVVFEWQRPGPFDTL